MDASMKQDLLKGAGILGALFTSMAAFGVVIHMDQTPRGCVIDAADEMALAYNPVPYAIFEFGRSLSGQPTSNLCAPGWKIK